MFKKTLLLAVLLISNIFSVLSQESFSCKFCDKELLNQSSFNIHLLQKHKDKINFSLVLKANRKKVRFIPYEKRVRQCKCGYSGVNLSRHRKIHQNIKDFVCDLCLIPSYFSSEGHLLRHQLEHE